MFRYRIATRLGKSTFESFKKKQVARQFSTHILKERLREIIPKKQSLLASIRKQYGELVIEDVKVNQVIGGMRGMTALIYETSKLDPWTGISYRGHPISEVLKKAPKAKNGDAPLPEGVLWLLLTGEYPTQSELDDLVLEMKERAYIPPETIKLIRSFPKETHPMTQLSMGMAALQPMSTFASQYREGMAKNKYWEVMFDDCINVIAKVSKVAALVFNNCYRDKAALPTLEDDTLDYGAKYGHMLGYDDKDFYDLLRLYIVIHMDHEGGNVSAHACRLAGSALTDPYLCFSSCMNGLAGPLHGLANQECLRWLLDFQDKFGTHWTNNNIKEYVAETLKSGKVVPGFGHAVLRRTDPRYEAEISFGERHFKDDNLIKLVRACYDVIPEELPKLKAGVANPFPNVDAASGALLMHYGLNQFDYYTVLFGVSRAFGVMSALLWDRALGLPIERPGSITIEGLQQLCETISKGK